MIFLSGFNGGAGVIVNSMRVFAPNIIWICYIQVAPFMRLSFYQRRT